MPSPKPDLVAIRKTFEFEYQGIVLKTVTETLYLSLEDTIQMLERIADRKRQEVKR